MPIPTNSELNRVLQGGGIKRAAKMYEVSVSTVYRWMDRLKIDRPDKLGCGNSNSSLTKDQVIEIFERKGITSVRDLSKEFGVSTGTISNIHSFKTHSEETAGHVVDIERSQIA